MKLEDFLAKVYDRTQRTHPTTSHRKVLRFANFRTDVEARYPLHWLGDGDTYVPGYHAKWQADPGTASVFWAGDWPTHIAVGASAGAASPNALADEMERVPITNRFDQGAEEGVEFSGPFKDHFGVGDWWEVGLFSGTAVEALLHTCNTLDGWTSGGTLILDTVEARWGSASLRFQGTSSQPFSCTALSTATGFSTSDRLQLWYYIDDPTKLVSETQFYLASGSADYWRYDVPKAELEAGWNWVSRVLSDYDALSGTPAIGALTLFGVEADTGGQETVQRLDRLRLFQESGDLWFREALGTAVHKGYGEVRWVYVQMGFEEA